MCFYLSNIYKTYARFEIFSMDKLAGVLLMGTAGVIPPMSVEHMETSCEINENKTIHPIAYRTHTHSLGKVVSGYRVRPDDHGQHHWTLLGKRDPLTPQMFYPVENSEPIVRGDIIAARCTMESHRNRITETGWVENFTNYCNFGIKCGNYFWFMNFEFIRDQFYFVSVA